MTPKLKGIHVIVLIFTFHSAESTLQKLSKCPGIYCGRVAQVGSQNISECGVCPRGYRTNGYTCIKCNSKLTFYDCLYLGFMVFIVPIINCHFITYFEPRRKFVGLLYLMTVIESIMSIIISLLVLEPVGKLTLTACEKHSIKDWYTVFFNPKPDYINTIRCTQEAVYPLFTVVFIYLAFCLLFSVTLRPVVAAVLKRSFGRKSLYATLYFLPILTVIHAIFSGVIYYAFPYMLLVTSSFGSAIYLSVKSDQIWSLWKNIDSLLILITYCLTNAYGITSITLFRQPGKDGALLIFIFLPILFYFLTFRLTDPRKFS